MYDRLQLVLCSLIYSLVLDRNVRFTAAEIRFSISENNDLNVIITEKYNSNS